MPKDAEALEEFTSRVRSALGVGLVELKLFGSKATGRDEVESDIDVLVVVDGARAELEDRVLDIAFDVNLAHDVYISPLVIDRSILDHPVWRITPFLQTVTKSPHRARKGAALAERRERSSPSRRRGRRTMP